MTLLVGDWVEPVVKHTATATTYYFNPKNHKAVKTELVEIAPKDVFIVYGSTPILQDVELVSLNHLSRKNKDQLIKYSVDPRTLRKIEGERLVMLQKLYNDSKKLSSRRNSRAV